MVDIPNYEFKSPDETIRFEICRIQDKAHIFGTKRFIHRNNFYVIFLIESGSGTYHIDFEDYRIQPNTIFFIAPQQIHYWDIEQELKGYLILFPADFLATVPLDENLRFPDHFSMFDWETRACVTIPAKRIRWFFTLATLMTHEFKEKNLLYRNIAVQNTLLLFIVNVQRVVNDTPLENQEAGQVIVRQFARLVNQHFQHTQSVKDYADMLSVTAGHLSDTIKTYRGITPLEYIHRRVVLEAKRLLIHTREPASAIAEALSFSDASYFGRFFKREVGETPNQFRHKYR